MAVALVLTVQKNINCHEKKNLVNHSQSYCPPAFNNRDKMGRPISRLDSGKNVIKSITRGSTPQNEGRMIPVMQTKVVVKNSKGVYVVRGNCYAAAIASIMELPISEVPNVEVFFHMATGYWQEVMQTFINSKRWELCCDDRYKVFHDGRYGVDNGKRAEYLNDCKNKYYLVSGKSARGVSHICIYRNGKMIHDPHPTKEGLLTEETFQTLEKQF